jgi:catechol 2,3-dioxygenase-like lactoylglutathione lyase family enzyme
VPALLATIEAAGMERNPMRPVAVIPGMPVPGADATVIRSLPEAVPNRYLSRPMKKRGRQVRAVPNSIGAITLFVENLESTKAFYQDVFALPVIYEDDSSAVVKFDNTMINLLQSSAAPELIEPAAAAGPGTGARCMFSIWVEDTDAACADLVRRGVELLNGPLNREWGKRTATFADPAGNIWEIAQDLP